MNRTTRTLSTYRSTHIVIDPVTVTDARRVGTTLAGNPTWALDTVGYGTLCTLPNASCGYEVVSGMSGAYRLALRRWRGEYRVIGLAPIPTPGRRVTYGLCDSCNRQDRLTVEEYGNYCESCMVVSA